MKTTQHNAGDRVLQPQYGTGTITYVNEYHTVIEFDDGRKATFVTSRVNLAVSDTVAPPKPKKVVRRKKAVAAVEEAPAEMTAADEDSRGLDASDTDAQLDATDMDQSDTAVEALSDQD